MAISNLFSTRRKAAERAGAADVYQYDSISAALRVQLQQIFIDAVGKSYEPGAYDYTMPPHNNEAWSYIRKTVCREHGRHQLTASSQQTAAHDVIECIGNERSLDVLFDVIEVTLSYLDSHARLLSEYEREGKGIVQRSADAIYETNHRMRAAGLGYQFESGVLIRVDSQYVHAEVIKPALALLSAKGFSGPQAEFLEAHEHYRGENYKDAITAAGRAFESVMKTICDKKGWPYPAGARASDLYKLIKSKGLFPDYLDSSFDQLISTLKSGLPQVRNEVGAHGGGANPAKTPSYVAAYAIHLAAAKIVLMVNAAGL